MNEFIDFALASEVPRHSTCQVGFVNPRVLHRTCLKGDRRPFYNRPRKNPSTRGIGIDRAAEMKLGLVPPLVLLCSDLLLHSSPPLISALPFDPLASGAAPTGRPPTLPPVYLPSLISAMRWMSCLRFSFSSFSCSLDLVVYGVSR